jgi:RNA polymerase sigma factor (sigma-70 family)
MMKMKQPFEMIVAQHGATVLRVCRAVLGPHTDADDAWSETFLAALKAWPTLPADANVQAWLVTIAHHKAIDVIRARQRQPITVDEFPERPSTIGVPGADHLDLWKAVAALSAKQRQAVAYHYLGGLPYQEIAQLLGGSTDAARRASSDGISALRRAFARERTGEQIEGATP